MGGVCKPDWEVLAGKKGTRAPGLVMHDVPDVRHTCPQVSQSLGVVEYT